MNHLLVIYQENKDSIGYFLKLFRLGKKEGLTPEQVIGLVKMADGAYKPQEKFHHLQGQVADLELRKSVDNQQLLELENKILGAMEQLSDIF